MGTALAGAVLDSDRVAVWNRSPGKATALAQSGAAVAPSADDAIAVSDVIVVCLVDYAAVDAAFANVKTLRFLALLGSWLAATGALLSGLATRIDSGDHARDAMSNLAMQAVAIDNIAAASREQGISATLIEPIARLVRERVAQSGGSDEISGIAERLRDIDARD